MMRRLFLLILTSLVLQGCTPSGPRVNADPATLKMALLPDESPSTIIANNEKLKEYLERELGKKIELVSVTDYSSLIEAVRHGRVHVAYLGPLSYVLARQRTDIEPFAALKTRGSTTYQAVLIGNIEAGIDSVQAIKGKQVAFGDHASTSSHLIPRAMLAKKGLMADTDYQPNYVGAHDVVALTVQTGKAQAGGLSKPIFKSLVERKLIDLKKVRVLEESEPFPQYPWTMRTDLKPELRAKIRRAFLTLKDPEVLKPFKAEGYGPVSDADYDKVRALGSVLKLDLGKLSEK
jgi:phosphonate transport system substrate-binding protein